jgi:protein phosphatase-4 regulatory subunit 3
MSADDAAKNTVPIESNNTENSSTDPTSATPREAVGESHSFAESGSSKPAENGQNGHADQEVESCDITEAVEVVKGEIEAPDAGTEPSLESFTETGDPSEIAETAEGVLAWSPEEDHEHKRVKVGYYSELHMLSQLSS